MIASGTFSQHKQFVGADISQTINGLLPETNRRTISIVAPETIHIGLVHPVFHGIYHFQAHIRIAKVKLSHIVPSVRTDNIA